ncbi:MAG: molybdopterin-dependent oxidoreductase [Acidimicrobiales bacterium]
MSERNATRTVPSVCRFCHAGCAILVDIEHRDGHDRLVRVRGDRENPVYRGFTCEKGRQLPDQHHHPDRLLQSMRKRRDGTHEPIASATAIKEIAARLDAIIAAHGPRSVAIYTGTAGSRNPAGRPMLNALMDAIGSPMRFDSNTIDQPGKAVAQALHGMWGAPPQDFDTADVTLLIGINPFVSMAGGLPMPDPVRRVREAQARGMRLLVVDPRRTETAAAAYLHLQPRPGEDIAIVAGILRVILTEGLADDDFCTAHVDGMVALEQAVAAFTPEHVAARADIDADDLVALARVFATGARGVAVSGTGPSFTGRGSTLLEYLVMVLNSVCGRYQRAGETVWNPSVLTAPIAHRAQAIAPWPAHGYGERMRARDLGEAACGLPTAALADEILWDGEDRVRALMCLGGNPVAAWPDHERTWQAMQALDLLVTCDIKMSATAKAAHYVVAPRLTLEMPGSTYVSEVMYHYAVGFGLPVPYAQYTPAIVEPPAGSDLLEEWKLFLGVAHELGLQLELRPNFARPTDAPWPLDADTPPTLDELIAFLYQHSRVPLDEVKRHPYGAVFDTGPVFVEPAEPGWEGRLDAGNVEMLAELSEAVGRWWPDDPAFPYRLVCRRHVGALNSSGRDLPRMQKVPYNPAFLHPDDLMALGLEAGHEIELRSATGVLRTVAAADPTLRRGLVSITHSYGDVPGSELSFRKAGSNANLLVRSDANHDRITGMPQLSNIPVAVRGVDIPVR